MDPLTVAVCIGVSVYVFDKATEKVKFNDLRAGISNALTAKNAASAAKPAQKQHRGGPVK